MTGNQLDKTYSLNNSDAEGLGIGLISLSWGQRVPVSFTDVFALGATVHMLYGGGYSKTERTDGSFVTRDYGFDVDVDYEFLYTYKGGIGLGLDVGAAAQLGGKWTVGASLSNVLGSIPWSGDVSKEVGYVRGDSLTAFRFADEDEDEDDVLTDSSWTVEGLPSFNTTLPVILRVGVVYREGPVLLSADFMTGFVEGPFASTKPRVSVGTEWRGVRWLPLRMGVVMGGRIGMGTSFGFGIHPGGFVLDVAVMNRGFLSGENSKGFLLGLELGVELNKNERDAYRVSDF